jgi:hypothetical protein
MKIFPINYLKINIIDLKEYFSLFFFILIIIFTELKKLKYSI